MRRRRRQQRQRRLVLGGASAGDNDGHLHSDLDYANDDLHLASNDATVLLLDQ